MYVLVYVYNEYLTRGDAALLRSAESMVVASSANELLRLGLVCEWRGVEVRGCGEGQHVGLVKVVVSVGVSVGVSV